MPLRPLLSGLLALAATSGIPRVGENEQTVETKKPGSEAPPFELETLDAKKVTSAELLGDAKDRAVLVLVFWSRQCPWVERWNPDLEALVQEFKKQPRVRFAVVDSDKNETGDPAAIRDYLAGKERKLVYTGRINDRRPPDAVAGAKPASPPPPDPLLRKAILAALEGKAPDVPVDAPTGCRIKRQ